MDSLAGKAALAILKTQWNTRLRDTQQLLQQHRSDLERAMFELASLKESAQNNNQKNYDLLLRISQEIHRPLAGIMGMTNLLLLSSLTDEQRRFAENARDHARLLLQRADTIQDFAQASFDATMVKSLDFDLHEILKNAVRSHLSQAQKKHLELSFQLPRDVPRSLRGDAVRLEQVLSHLLDNAIRFTDQGQVAVSASRLAGPPPNLLLKFEVRDTGTGISPEDQARLFIAGGSSIDPKSGGLGLSLVVCRYLVKLMHGEIGVSSEPGIGSTFWFTVSMEEASILHN
jgi:signal transduction histidine kinase